MDRILLANYIILFTEKKTYIRFTVINIVIPSSVLNITVITMLSKNNL